VVIPVFAGFPIQLPGFFEIQLGMYSELFGGLNPLQNPLDGDSRWRLSGSIVWEASYARQVSWFLQLSGILGKESSNHRDDLSDAAAVSLEGGPSFLLAPVWKVRLRLGPRVGLRVGQPRLDWGFQISFVQ
jgi:hypothetical protein